MSSYLLDTHTWLFAISDKRKLSAKVRRILEDSTNTFYFSIASVWEIAIKMSRGKLRLETRGDLDTFITRINAGAGVQSLSVGVADACAVLRLPFYHSDPFDRLLVAQAAAKGLTILSMDRHIRAYDVKVIW